MVSPDVLSHQKAIKKVTVTTAATSSQPGIDHFSPYLKWVYVHVFDRCQADEV
jgi:hypothetical protein